MISTGDGPRYFRFSTEAFPARERASAVRGLHESGRLPGRLEPLEPLPDHPVCADFTQWTLPGLGVLTGTFGGLRQRANPQASSADDDDFFLAVNLAGRSVTVQGDRELRLRGGDAFIASRGKVGFTITRPGQVRFIGLRMPRAALTPLLGRFDDDELRSVPRDSGALMLLAKYVATGVSTQTLATPMLRSIFATHVYDLAALAVGATQQAAMIAEGRGVRAARLEAIKSDIATNLGDYRLSVATIAVRRGVSARYVQKIFESEGRTFSEFVLDQRLVRAHRMLTDSRFADRSISSIAYDVGFGDLSYFNRAFRRRYGETPSEVKRG